MGSGKGTSKRVRSTATEPDEIIEDVEGVPAKEQKANAGTLRKQYLKGVEYLDDNFAEFLTNVINIGNPKPAYDMPTAAVGIPLLRPNQTRVTQEDLKRFQFYFSPKFANELNDEEMGFVLAHETMHILLNHLKLGNTFNDKELANIAMDIVINDYLKNIGIDNIMRPDDNGDLQPFGWTGEKALGRNCASSAVTEVYNKLYKKKKEDEDFIKKLKEQMPKFGGGDGSGDGNDTSDMKGSVDGHDWMHDQAGNTDAQNVVDQIAQESQKDKKMPAPLRDKKSVDEKGMQAKNYSLNAPDTASAFKENGLEMSWASLLKEVDPDIVKGKGRKNDADYTFARPNRKISYAYPKIVLPSLQNDARPKKRKESIVLALDTSGSIGQNTANDFVNLARSIPQDKVDLKVCTFTTSYMPLDLEDPQYNSGGTNFSAITKYIENEVLPNNKNLYPKSVIVVTDGQAIFGAGDDPDEEQAKSWHWLLQSDHDYENFSGSGGGYYGDRNPVKNIGVMHKLSEFVKNDEWGR